VGSVVLEVEPWRRPAFPELSLLRVAKSMALDCAAGPLGDILKENFDLRHAMQNDDDDDDANRTKSSDAIEIAKESVDTSLSPTTSSVDQCRPLLQRPLDHRSFSQKLYPQLLKCLLTHRVTHATRKMKPGDEAINLSLSYIPLGSTSYVGRILQALNSMITCSTDATQPSSSSSTDQKESFDKHIGFQHDQSSSKSYSKSHYSGDYNAEMHVPDSTKMAAYVEGSSLLFDKVLSALEMDDRYRIDSNNNPEIQQVNLHGVEKEDMKWRPLPWEKGYTCPDFAPTLTAAMSASSTTQGGIFICPDYVDLSHLRTTSSMATSHSADGGFQSSESQSRSISATGGGGAGGGGISSSSRPGSRSNNAAVCPIPSLDSVNSDNDNGSMRYRLRCSSGTTHCRIRAGPSLESAEVGHLANYSIVDIAGRVGDFYRLADGRGYVKVFVESAVTW
jgi:hypothetical protein